MNNYGYGYPYFGNNYGYGVPQQQAQQYYQPQQQMQPTYQQMPQQAQQMQPRQKYSALTYVNGLVGAKSHILNPNEKIYLLDSDNPILYIKSADFEGKYSLEAFELNKVELEKIGVEKEQAPTIQPLTKQDLNEFVSKSDLKALERQFMSSIDKLSSLVENALKTPKNGNNARNGG